MPKSQETEDERKARLSEVAEVRKKTLELMAHAMKDAKKAYAMLWKHLEMGEKWAFHVFFNKFLLVNSDWFKSVDLEGVEVSIDTIENRAQLQANLLQRAIASKHLTAEQALHAITILEKLNITEVFNKSDSVFNLLSNEKKEQVYDWLIAARDEKRKKEDDDE